MDQKLFNKILLIILIIETIFLAGIVGCKIGEAKEVEQPIYYITLQVDPSMIEYPEADEPEPTVEDVAIEVVPEPETAVIEPSYTEEEVEYLAMFPCT